VLIPGGSPWVLPSFFCCQPIRQSLNFRVRQNVHVRGTESGHGTTSDVNPMLNFRSRQSCPDVLEVRPDAAFEVRSVAADAVFLKQLNGIRILACAV
jgi:hypothetical protein